MLSHFYAHPLRQGLDGPSYLIMFTVLWRLSMTSRPGVLGDVSESSDVVDWFCRNQSDGCNIN
jgi:hypothetical protein